MAKIKVTQVISTSGCTERQKANLRCLGIRKMHQSVEIEATPVALGQIQKVAHIVTVEEITKKK